MKYLNEEFLPDLNPWEGLNIIEKKMSYFNNRIKELEKELPEKNGLISEQKHIINELHEKFRKKDNIMNKLLSDNKEEIEKLQSQIRSLNQFRNNLDKEINEKQNKIEEIISKGDPIFLREGIINISNYCKNLILKNINFQNKSDSELIDFISNSIKEFELNKNNEILELKNLILEKDKKIEQLNQEKNNMVKKTSIDLPTQPPVQEIGRRKYTVRENVSRLYSQNSNEGPPLPPPLPEAKIDDTPVKELIIGIGKKAADLLERNYLGTTKTPIKELCSTIHLLLDDLKEETQTITDGLVKYKKKMKQSTKELTKIKDSINNFKIISNLTDPIEILNFLFNKYNEGSTPLLNEISKLNRIIEDFKSFEKLMLTRLNGIIKNNINYNLPIQNLILSSLNDIQDLIDEFNNKIKKENNNNLILYNGLISIGIRIKESIGEINFDLNSLKIENLIIKINLFLDQLLNPIFSDSYIRSSDIYQICLPLKPIEKIHPKEFLKDFVQELFQNRQILLTFNKIENDLEKVLIEVNNNNNNNFIKILENFINELNNNVSKLVFIPINQKFFGIIYKFNSLLQTIVISNL